MNTDRDLSYFLDMLDRDLTDVSGYPAEKWDQRADAWEKEYNDPASRKSEDRVQATVEYLMDHGLLGPDCDVADIGCGPGRFVAAFARTARYVTGFDLSEKMIQHASAYIHRENLRNVSLHTGDFRTLDVEREGLARRFDLVFSSNTPAVHGAKSLEKIMEMSRKYCCDINYIRSENALEQRIMDEVFARGRTDPRAKHWHWFYAAFNVLFLSGYHPEATYYIRHTQSAVSPGPERAKLFVEQMLPRAEQSPENEARVCAWLREHAETGGFITEVSDIWYSRLLWDVRAKTSYR